MIDKVHQHIMNELQQSSRTDTIFVLTAILFNLIVLAVNSGVASSAVKENLESSADAVLVVFLVMAIIYCQQHLYCRAQHRQGHAQKIAQRFAVHV